MAQSTPANQAGGEPFLGRYSHATSVTFLDAGPQLETKVQIVGKRSIPDGSLPDPLRSQGVADHRAGALRARFGLRSEQDDRDRTVGLLRVVVVEGKDLRHLGPEGLALG